MIEIKSLYKLWQSFREGGEEFLTFSNICNKNWARFAFYFTVILLPGSFSSISADWWDTFSGVIKPPGSNWLNWFWTMISEDWISLILNCIIFQPNSLVYMKSRAAEKSPDYSVCSVSGVNCTVYSDWSVKELAIFEKRYFMPFEQLTSNYAIKALFYFLVICRYKISWRLISKRY